MTGNELLVAAANCRSAAEETLRRRRRCLDYAFGRQWNDYVMTERGLMTEHEYIRHEGQVPLTNNLIRRIVRNVLGVFRKHLDSATDITDGNDALWTANSLKELYCRVFEEYLVSGMAVCRKWFGVRGGVAGVWTEAVSPPAFFFNPDATDFRGWDLNTVGVVHSVDFRQWCGEFVRSPSGYDKALRLFGKEGDSRRRSVVEIWRREQRPRLMVHDRGAGMIRVIDAPAGGQLSLPKGVKWFLDDVWRYYFVAEDGTILRCGDTPYSHGSHPFVFRAYPFIDGEIHSFVADIIDQQRYTNRLITLYDWTIRASAKGVLLLPEGCCETSDIDEIANQWSRFNGVITYKAKAGQPEPKQVTGTTAGLGIADLLDIQLKMLEDVSGVNATLQGNLSAGSVSGTLYNLQTENALTSLKDIIESYMSYIADCNALDKTLQQQIMPGSTAEPQGWYR